jgi:hypothetical protein
VLELLCYQPSQLPVLLLQFILPLDTCLFDIPFLHAQPLTGDPEPLYLSVLRPDLRLQPIQLLRQLVMFLLFESE